MVLAERNSELVRNGRRSRGPSPNGHGGVTGSGGGIGSGGGANASNNTNQAHNAGPGGAGTPETSSDDDNSIKRNGKTKNKQSEYEEKIRVGRDYQAVCPPLIPESERKPEMLNERALLVWSPTKEIPDSKLEEYISVAKEKYGYNGEQALGMLFWHKHDLERAVMDLANFTPFPDEWTVEDKVLFEQAFQFHGKSFHRIRQMLPDKSIASLVKYYYSWKKTRHRQSAMDRHEKPKVAKEGSENGSENGSNEESDADDKVQANKQKISALKRKNSENIDDLRPPENPARINARWTNDELMMAVQGVRKFGKDFQSIAETLGTKTEAHVRTFYINYRRRYNLDQVLKEYEADKDTGEGGGGGAGGGGSGGGNSTVATSTVTNITSNTASGTTASTATAGNATETSISTGTTEILIKSNKNNDSNSNNTASSTTGGGNNSANKKDELKRKDSSASGIASSSAIINNDAGGGNAAANPIIIASTPANSSNTNAIASTAATSSPAAAATITTATTTTTICLTSSSSSSSSSPIVSTSAAAAAAAAVAATTASSAATTDNNSIANTATAAGIGTNNIISNIIITDESDNTTSSETNASKSTIDEVKSISGGSSINIQKDNTTSSMEFDYDGEQVEIQQPAKKLALSIANQDFPKASDV